MGVIQQIKQNARIEQVIASRISLDRAGTVYKGRCPFHSEKTPSFTVSPKKQRYKCFGCGEAGDVLDFLQKFHNWTREQAMNYLDNKPIFSPVAADDRPLPVSKIETSTCILPAPDPGQITHRKYGAPAAHWIYRNAEGKALFAVCRFNDAAGKKVAVLPYSYWQDEEGNRFWAWRGAPTPRPLYNLHSLAANPKKNILLVEGEKTADAAQALFPHMVVMTWCGGSNAVSNADWAPLAGKNVLYWPDLDWSHRYGDAHKYAGQICAWEDQPAGKASIEIFNHLESIAAKLKYIIPPDAKPCGWDLADSEEGEDWQAHAKGNLLDFSEAIFKFSGGQPHGLPADEWDRREPEELPDFELSEVVPQGDYDNKKPTRGDFDHAAYYRPLGYEVEDNATRYWFFNISRQAVLRFSASALARESTLFELAPVDFWEASFAPSKSRRKIDTTAACANLIAECEQAGYFSPDHMRGRGCWFDEGRIVFNTGDEIIDTDFTVHSYSDFASKSVYNRGEYIGLSMPPLSDAQALELFGAFDLINWERPVSRYLAAGWAVLAPFCGALDWRPHIWITGVAGSGKSWILQNIIRPMLGDACQAVQSNSTEAGIRQALKSDALPVVFDEAEGEDDTSAARMKAVLELARAASSSDGGQITKGSAAGKASKHTIRSMFAFSSIVPVAVQESDLSRITMLALQAPSAAKDREARWEGLKRSALLFTSQNTDALRCRTFKILPVIIENARTFSEAVTEVVGSRRAGDQIGMLLAGAYSMQAQGLIGKEKAVEFVRKQDWQDEQPIRENSDEMRLLTRILETQLKFGKGSFSRTIGELALISAGFCIDGDVTKDEAQAELKRIGLLTDEDRLYISNNSLYVKSILKGTPWAASHHKVLVRLDDAQKEEPRKFAATTSRSVSVSIFTFHALPFEVGEAIQGEIPF